MLYHFKKRVSIRKKWLIKGLFGPRLSLIWAKKLLKEAVQKENGARVIIIFIQKLSKLSWQHDSVFKFANLSISTLSKIL